MGFFLFTLILSIAWLLFNRQFSNGQAEPTTHPPLLEPTAKWPLSGHLEPGAHQTPSSEGPVSTSTLNHPPGRLLLSGWHFIHLGFSHSISGSFWIVLPSPGGDCPPREFQEVQCSSQWRLVTWPQSLLHHGRAGVHSPAFIYPWKAQRRGSEGSSLLHSPAKPASLVVQALAWKPVLEGEVWIQALNKRDLLLLPQIQ